MAEAEGVHPIAEFAMTTVASYRLITLHDQDNDAGVGSAEAIDRLETAIAASTGYELFIGCVQDLFPVTVRVLVRDDEPGRSAGKPRLSLECPTGRLVLGSPTGEVADFELATGPGEYDVAVTHRGRDEARRVLREALESTEPDALEQLGRHAGLEGYTISLWYRGPVEDE
ncbi:Uncharacterised protein [Amycolatopsis camponoti]|uniref:Uncharacterized protein n=1 Tax=Amycolatopsis camponoti TaxID=2606593 RepID=A0A6I8LPP2_9PSEU|nr:hypothetical protein [Amycolatopsis camponoti]VVJ17695.1 Uncharacterised protein [Amycolatopsis camponoti]